MRSSQRADPWCGADEPEWRAAAIRPTRCGVDEPKRACWRGRPLKRGRRTLTKASYLSKRAGPRVGPMNPSKQPELPSGAGLLRTVEPGAAVSWRDRCSALRLGSLAETGCRPRLPYSVSPNARKAVREHPGMNAVTAIRVRILCGFHRARPERRRRSRDERWRLSAR